MPHCRPGTLTGPHEASVSWPPIPGNGPHAFQAAQGGALCDIVDMLLQHRGVVTIGVLDIILRRRAAPLELLEVEFPVLEEEPGRRADEEVGPDEVGLTRRAEAFAAPLAATGDDVVEFGDRQSGDEHADHHAVFDEGRGHERGRGAIRRQVVGEIREAGFRHVGQLAA